MADMQFAVMGSVLEPCARIRMSVLARMESTAAES